MRKSKKGVANVFTTATGVLKAGVSAIRDAMAPAQTSAGDMPSIRFETLEPRVLLSADAAPVIAGSIDSPGETDKYEFVLQQGAQVVFDSLTDRSDLSWSLQGPQGDVVLGRALDATDGSGLTGSPVMTLAAGKYTLTLSGAGDATGDYRFRLLDLANTAMPLTPGVTTAGVLSPANGTNVYQFNALAGDLYYFDHKSSTGSNDRWCLIDPHGRLVFDRSLSGSVMEPDTLAHSGVYTLLIEGAVNQTGAEAGYSFNVQPVTNDEVIGMPLGSSVTGSIGQAGQQDYYRFNLAAPTQAYFDVLTSANVTWTLSGPRGTVVSSRDFSNSDATGLSGNLLMDLAAGDYTLMIDGVNDMTGAYGFRLLDLSQSAVSLTPGMPVSATLSPGSETDAYRFDATAAIATILTFSARPAPAGSIGGCWIRSVMSFLTLRPSPWTKAR